MNAILSIAKNDLRILSRDKIGMFFILVFPIVMGLFFGMIMGGDQGGGGRGKMRIALVDRDKSEVSKQFVSSFAKNDSIDLVESTRDEAIEQVRKGRLVGVIILPEKFGEAAGLPWAEPPELEIGIDPSRQAEAAMAQGFVMQSMGQLITTRFQDPEMVKPFINDLRDQLTESGDVPFYLRPAVEKLADSMDSMFDSIAQIQQKEKEESSNGEAADGAQIGGFQFAKIKTIDVTYQPEPGSIAAIMKKTRSRWDITFPQSMLWGVLACVAGFSISFVREKTQGTLVRLQVAPISHWHVLVGKALGCFIAVIGILVTLTVIGYFLGMRPRSFGLLTVAAGFVAFCFVGIMMLMSVIGKTEEAVGGASWGVNMILAMFGGCMIPIMFMPSFMVPLSNLSPVKWAILSLEGAIWRGFTLAEMMFPLSVLFGVGLVTMLTGSYLIKRAS